MLVEEFSGPSTPCFGFALGLERLISVIPFNDEINLEKQTDVFIVHLGKLAQSKVFNIAQQLRSEELAIEYDYEGGSMKSQMRKANKSASRFALIIGENEVKTGIYQLKNMTGGEQLEISAESCAEEIKKLLKGQN